MVATGIAPRSCSVPVEHRESQASASAAPLVADCINGFAGLLRLASL